MQRLKLRIFQKFGNSLIIFTLSIYEMWLVTFPELQISLKNPCKKKVFIHFKWGCLKIIKHCDNNWNLFAFSLYFSFFICYLAAPRLNSGHCWEDSLWSLSRGQPRSPSVNLCVLSIFIPKVLGSLVTSLSP